MKLEHDWGECRYCGSTASVTWLRGYTQAGENRQRSEVRVGVRCLNPDCPGPQRDTT